MNQELAGQDFAEAEGILVGSELLNGQYSIQSRLRSGGFGIAYVARDSLARNVVVKECFPAELCLRRNGNVEPQSKDLLPQFKAIKNQFIREARQMAKLTHPNIVAVHQVFEENNTAYMALDQIQGCDLVSLYDETPERITNDLLKSVLYQSLKAINFIHSKGLLHRDIAPDNLMIDEWGHLTLIDFGAARELEEQNRSTVFAVKDGYSPYEFYMPDGVHNRASDLYSLGATLHYLITGETPPVSEDRLMALKEGAKDPYERLAGRKGKMNIFSSFDELLLASIDKSLAVKQTNRFRSAGEWADMLSTKRKLKVPTGKRPAMSATLEVEIAQIVEKTNAALKPVSEAEARRRAAEEKRAKAELAQKNQKMVFDIFGNPIDDITRWQAEQDKEIQARATEETVSPTPEPVPSEVLEDIPEEMPEHDPEPKQRKKGLLSGLFGRYVKSKDDAVSTQSTP